MFRRLVVSLLVLAGADTLLPRGVLGLQTCSSKEPEENGADLVGNASSPPLLRGTVREEDVAELIVSARVRCAWAPTCPGCARLDCKLPMDNTTRRVAEALLRLVLPPHCDAHTVVDSVPFLPVRKFPPGAVEAGHVDRGPAWTVLLHLSAGKTVFGLSAGPPAGRLAVAHGPGDVLAWWNTGHSPEHTGEPAAFGEKVIVNFGVRSPTVLRCDGLEFFAAGGEEHINFYNDCMGAIFALMALGVTIWLLAELGGYFGYTWWKLPLYFWGFVVIGCCCYHQIQKSAAARIRSWQRMRASNAPISAESLQPLV